MKITSINKTVKNDKTIIFNDCFITASVFDLYVADTGEAI